MTPKDQLLTGLIWLYQEPTTREQAWARLSVEISFREALARRWQMRFGGVTEAQTVIDAGLVEILTAWDFSRTGSIISWLYNLLKNIIRKQSWLFCGSDKEVESTQHGEPWQELTDLTKGQLEPRHDEIEDARRLLQIVKRHATPRMVALFLLVVNDTPQPEIAAILGTTVDAVKCQLLRDRKMLRKIIATLSPDSMTL